MSESGSCRRSNDPIFITVDFSGQFSDGTDSLDLGGLIDVGFVTSKKSCFNRREQGDFVCLEKADKKWQKSVYTSEIVGQNAVADMAYDLVSGNYFYILLPPVWTLDIFWTCSGDFDDVQDSFTFFYKC